MIVNKKNVILFLISLGAVVLLSACGDKNAEMKKLQEYVDRIKEGPSKQVEALPEIKKLKKYSHKKRKRRSPFFRKKKSGAHKLALASPPNHGVREPLEAYPLKKLKMVGVIHSQNAVWALVQTPDGAVKRVGLGGYLGTNNGRVLKIDNDKIQLVETVQTSGGWAKREATLTLARNG